MVHPSTDNFWRRGLGWARQPLYLGVSRAMRAFIAAALLFVAVAATSFGGPATGDREHILGADSSAKREHIL
ncbi:hypothetical protein Lesp01_62320 [Lentzea sp. NBRC 102530]|nr:hypothetical protein Lesp01_62320 [Lentzea sp. NBRC 102530]